MLLQTFQAVHIRSIHLGIKPFECPHCNTRFSQLGHRNRHVLVSYFVPILWLGSQVEPWWCGSGEYARLKKRFRVRIFCDLTFF